ncbi:hypothetical protein PXH66_03330 [Synoicihabitans lomoniglobus]|uniref:Uncharacterized protein n=1 Tax=Synoicihabitans lomoniglobus TaxID=2909285 RepID=A0AAF0I326_9BACT|nr:hypothetical protein PXH66_03330 [Opitutaceae bacterium LMO-M01]
MKVLRKLRLWCLCMWNGHEWDFLDADIRQTTCQCMRCGQLRVIRHDKPNGGSLW